MKWQNVQLGTIAKIDWGNTNLTKSCYVKEGKYLAVSATGPDGLIDYYEHEEDTTVISAIGANCGKVFFPSKKFTAIKNTMTVKPNASKIHKKYLFWALSNSRFNIRGAGQPFLSKADTEKLDIILPPLQIQEQIANTLDKADALLRKDQELLTKYDELAKASFYEMFGDPVKNDKGWKRKQASEYYEVRGRVGWKGYKKTDLREKGVLVLGATHINNLGEINLSKAVYISDEKFIESPEIAININDLIFVQRGNTIGKVGLVREDIGDATINPVVLIFRPKNTIPLFLLHLLLNVEQNRELVNSNSGSAQPMITQEFMRNYFYIDVPIELQEIFSNRINNIESQKSKIFNASVHSEKLFKYLIQKAFKDELVL